MQALETQTTLGRWKKLTLWCRWHRHHGVTSFPDDHPANFERTQEIARYRLISTAIEIRRYNNESNRLQLMGMNKHGRWKKKWRTYQKMMKAALREYRALWKLYAEIGLLDPAWGSREHFLQYYQPDIRTTRPPW